MMDLVFSETAMPVLFVGLMGLSILVYVILDGFDLGVGILMGAAEDHEKDVMVASIGPFWDANETWLVLAVGLLLVAFPVAHGEILTALYVPTAAMLAGLILRGVAFDFRVKAPAGHKTWWNRAFVGGSLLAALAQGFMLGLYITGFSPGLPALAFALLVGLCLACAYAFIGAGWLILKTEGALQRRAVSWARGTLWFAVLGMVAVSVATPLLNPRVFEKWFSLPELFYLAPIPLATAGLFVWLFLLLRRLPAPGDRLAWAPFAGSIGVFLLGFAGLAYSFYPYVVPERLTVWDAAAAPESLAIILVGAVLALPVVIGATVFSYRVFRGKSTELRYD